MKNKHLINRIAGLLSAASLTFSAVAPTAVQAEQKSRTYNEDELVKVIVTLYGDPILAMDGAEEGADFLDSSLARDRAEQLANNRERVFDEILDLYPQATLDLTYDSLLNGFACTVPEELTDDIEALHDVKSAAVSLAIEMPELYTANEVTGVESFIDSTSLTGEGQVIAVIDTELNTDHDMFAPLADDVNVKLTKDDIINAINNRGLNCNLDPEKVYLSSKLPFAACYAKPDDLYGVTNDVVYHGTHVAGIAAGNRVTTEFGIDLHGVAPDAQLLFMSACPMTDDSGNLEDAEAVAAIEDAVKLGADVINMSFGKRAPNPATDSIYDEVLENADNAGVVVCVSAGNNHDPGGTPDTIDNSTLNSPGDRKQCFSVAAANVSHKYDYRMYLADGTEVPFSNYGAFLPEEAIEYVDCGDGTEEGFPKESLTGKLALIKLASEDDVSDAGYHTLISEAEGALIYIEDNEYPDFDETKTDYDVRCFINKEVYEALLAQEDKTVSFTGTLIPDTVQADICDFSSKGTKQDLTLKPEISAPGGDILSAGYYDCDYMSGTSMASPYVAGCAALVNQYLTKNGLAAQGADKARQIKDILMNTAVPAGRDVEISPRSQGAGVVNMNRMTSAKVLMRHNGKAAAELGDRLENTFSFDVTLENFSNEDVTFSEAVLNLSTDSADEGYEGYYLSGTKRLGCEISYPEDKLSIPAGGNVTFPVTVTLSADEAAENDEVFTHGWFVEGFLYMRGAENCCDISMPVIGFHGDWYTLPILGRDDRESGVGYKQRNYITTEMTGNKFPASLSFSQLFTAETNLIKSGFTEAGTLAYREELAAARDHEYFISPNSDGAADTLNYTIIPDRDGTIDKVEVLDENGVSIPGVETFASEVSSRESDTLYFFQETSYTEGKYTLKITSHIYAPDAEERTQSKEVAFNVDLTSPVLSDVVFTEKDGRKLLTITAQDDNLEGFYIIGNGTGCEAGKTPKTNVPITVLNDVFMEYSEFYNYYEDPYNEHRRPATHSTDLVTFLAQMGTLNYHTAYDFIDAIPAVTDKDGKMTVTYDVTDLTAYSITAADRAYNTVCYAPDRVIFGKLPTTVNMNCGAEFKLPEAPEITNNDGEITDQGWEIKAGVWWEPADEYKVVSYDMHKGFLRYYAETSEGRYYSSPIQISINGIYTLNMEIYEGDELFREMTTYPGSFSMDGFDPEADYTVKMTAEGRAPRTVYISKDDTDKTFEKFLYAYGDTNGDGTINVTDISKTAAHVKGVKNLDGYEQAVADVSKDGTVNVTDVSKLAAKVKGIKTIHNS